MSGIIKAWIQELGKALNCRKYWEPLDICYSLLRNYSLTMYIYIYIYIALSAYSRRNSNFMLQCQPATTLIEKKIRALKMHFSCPVCIRKIQAVKDVIVTINVFGLKTFWDSRGNNYAFHSVCWATKYKDNKISNIRSMFKHISAQAETKRRDFQQTSIQNLLSKTISCCHSHFYFLLKHKISYSNSLFCFFLLKFQVALLMSTWPKYNIWSINRA